VERDHALGVRLGSGFDDDLLRAANAENDHPDEDLPSFEALGASAHLDRVIFDGADYGTGAVAGSPEEEDYLGLPGLLDPDQVALLLHRRQADQLAAQRGSGRATKVEARPLTAAEELTALRRELNTLVNALVIRGAGSHAAIHAELRRTCGGPPTAQATAEEIRARLAHLRRRP
jgi:hypothetical protein